MYNFFFFKNIKKQQYAHTKSVARLVNSENLSKNNNNNKQQHAHTKSVARLVDCENWSKINIYIYIFFFLNNNTHTQKVLLD